MRQAGSVRGTMSSHPSVVVDDGSIEIDNAMNEVVLTLTIIGHFDPTSIQAIRKVSVEIIETDITIERLGIAARWKLIVIGNSSRCASVVRAIEYSVRGDKEGLRREINTANNQV